MSRILALTICIVTGLSVFETAAGDTLYPHHTVTLSFEGPETSEVDATNPFTNYRLLVTFRHGNTAPVVRGFYAADGQAADSGATNGNVWQVRFSPSKTGLWSWSAELRRGTDLAISDDPVAGELVPLHNAEGTFEVAPLPTQMSQLRDLRTKEGRLCTDQHYFRFGTSGPYVLKVGANSPENLLAYADFDGTYRIAVNERDGEAKATKELHKYAPHVKDWQAGDPTWGDGKGKALIGAVNYLASTGMNSVYFLTMNIGGDGKDVWPYIAADDFTRFDCSKLDQWEVLFEHMQRRGLILHVVLQETENETLLDGGDMGRHRQLYYRELIARFAHHPALIWNLGEENGPAPFSPDGQTTEQQKAMADYLASHDPYAHPIVIHTHASAEHQESVLATLLGHRTLSGISHQIGRPDNVHDWIADWRRRSDEANHPWVVSMDEIGPYDVGALPDSHDPAHSALREQVLWGALMAGAAGVEWYFGSNAPETDLACEDWRSRDALWQQTRIAADFFQEHLSYWELTLSDDLVTGAKAYCLAKPPEQFVIYRLGQQADANLQLDLRGSTAKYRVRWFSPTDGGQLRQGSVAAVKGGQTVQIGMPPETPGQDWVVLLDQQ